MTEKTFRFTKQLLLVLALLASLALVAALELIA